MSTGKQGFGLPTHAQGCITHWAHLQNGPSLGEGLPDGIATDISASMLTKSPVGAALKQKCVSQCHEGVLYNSC